MKKTQNKAKRQLLIRTAAAACAITAVVAGFCACGGKTADEPLELADPEQPPEKQTIVIGTVYGVEPALQKAVSNFNQTSDAYSVEIKDYVTTDAPEEGRARLNLDIVSGNGPDIIGLTNLPNIRELADKGVFEDLAPGSW